MTLSQIILIWEKKNFRPRKKRTRKRFMVKMQRLTVIKSPIRTKKGKNRLEN
jgi:hypothetical protein